MNLKKLNVLGKSMSQSGPSDNILKTILLLNGLGDLTLGFSLLFLSDILASTLSFPHSAEIQYLAGGWGIATLTLGGLRVVAGRSSDSRIIRMTAFFGLLEGGLLSLFGLMMVVLNRLTFSQVSLAFVFSALFTIAYLWSFLWRTHRLLKG